MQDRSVPLPLRSIAPGHDRFLVNERTSSHPDQAVKCPRCDSLNTKFCYYNNYNVSQPRYFCRNCRRYWTKGGVLRNVPIGGGCRKTTRPKGKKVKKLGVDRLQKESTGNTSLSSNEVSMVTHWDPSSSAVDLSIQSNLTATSLFSPPSPPASSPQIDQIITLRQPILPNLNLMERAETADINQQGRNSTGKFMLSSAVEESTVPFPVLALQISPLEVDTGDKYSSLPH